LSGLRAANYCMKPRCFNALPPITQMNADQKQVAANFANEHESKPDI
jgi:hypothetical protein